MHSDSTKETAITKLSPAEYRVCRLVAQGMTNNEIAEELIITERTVRWHMEQIFSKFSVNNRVKAANMFRKVYPDEVE